MTSTVRTARSTRTAADDLRVVLDHWQHLRALIDTATPDIWPPVMDADACPSEQNDVEAAAAPLSPAAWLARPGETDQDDKPVERERLVLAETPAPLRLHVVDACVAVETELCELADEIAADVQRPIISGPDPKWSPADRQRRLDLVEQDAEDYRRWHYTRTGRTAPHAAEWLLDRLVGRPGICAPINDAQRARIAHTARAAARRIERTIGADRRHVDLPYDRPCPWCGGVLTMHRGGDDGASVTCETGLECAAPVPLVEGRHIWSTPHELAELAEALDAAERRRRRTEARRRQRAAARERAAA